MESNSFYLDPSASHGNMFFLPVFQGGNMEETSKRRPFFSSSEDLYDDQLPDKKRRLTTQQVHLLEKSFETDNKLEPERKTQLALKLSLQPRQVAVWFQNRRARSKTKQLELDYDLLKSTYDQLLSNYDSILIHNHQLRSQVTSLTEKLQANEATAFEPPVNLSRSEPTIKTEDRLSSVVDEDAPQQVDSCEEDNNNNTKSCFDDIFVPTITPSHHHGDSLGFWPGWS